MLMQEILEERYEYIFNRRLQSDPLENRFSQYRQMNGGRFLVSLREVSNTKRILPCRSLLKENINFGKEGLRPLQKNDNTILLDIWPSMNQKYMNSFCQLTAKWYIQFQVKSQKN